MILARHSSECYSGIQSSSAVKASWIPAFAGMTKDEKDVVYEPSMKFSENWLR